MRLNVVFGKDVKVLGELGGKALLSSCLAWRHWHLRSDSTQTIAYQVALLHDVTTNSALVMLIMRQVGSAAKSDEQFVDCSRERGERASLKYAF